MLKAIMSMPVDRDDGQEWYWSLITGDEPPASSYITGADVEGMNDDDRLAAGSAICTPGANFVAYKDEYFTQRSS